MYIIGLQLYITTDSRTFLYAITGSGMSVTAPGSSMVAISSDSGPEDHLWPRTNQIMRHRHVTELVYGECALFRTGFRAYSDSYLWRAQFDVVSCRILRSLLFLSFLRLLEVRVVKVHYQESRVDTTTNSFIRPPYI